MEIKIKNTSKDVLLHGVKCAIYGESGVGKTRLLATAPKPLIISTEHGLLSLRDKNIPYVEIETVHDVQEVYDWITESKEANQYQTIAMDGISELAELLLLELKPTVKDKRNAYGDTADSVGTMLRNFRDLKGPNVVFTAKMRKMEDEDLGITYFVPLLPGKVLPQGLPYLVDEVFCMQIHEEGTYGQDDYQRYSYLQTFNTSKIVAKDRSGCLDEYEYPGDGDDIPNLTVLFNKIKKGIVK